jgi:bifunctional DNA-binding transcriptional regulator/antitoxin component of YhaV-PrlF toxin-antitoxin module
MANGTRTAHVNTEGRITIPADLRKQHGIELDTDIEIENSATGIELRATKKTCVFCGDPDPAEKLFGKPVCESCFDKNKFVL